MEWKNPNQKYEIFGNEMVKHEEAGHSAGKSTAHFRTKTLNLLGSSGRVVNSLDFYPALLKSLGCFYFRCVLSPQWKAVKWICDFHTANFKDTFGGP